MRKEIEKILKKIKEMNRDKIEFNTQLTIIEIQLKKLIEKLGK